MIMSRDEWIALGAAALRAEDKNRKENDLRPYSETNLRYDIAARIVYDIFVDASIQLGRSNDSPV